MKGSQTHFKKQLYLRNILGMFVLDISYWNYTIKKWSSALFAIPSYAAEKSGIIHTKSTNSFWKNRWNMSILLFLFLWKYFLIYRVFQKIWANYFFQILTPIFVVIFYEACRIHKFHCSWVTSVKTLTVTKKQNSSGFQIFSVVWTTRNKKC